VRLNTLIGEFLHNTRSSLDHLAWQLVLSNSGEPSLATCFPILQTAPTTQQERGATPSQCGGRSVRCSSGSH
jgi:hypothetical protein